MSGTIKILPQALSNKIAAGEVVNRPESVVKELVENSIDAGATDISVIIKDAGKSLIQIVDNGSGMIEEDAIMSFQRHSTSKIYSYDDLEAINTLGFRGEALASICSISQVEMKTKTAGDDVGTLIRVEGNEVTEVTKTTTPIGTSIAVKNLFYNTPGRRNFLKSNQTEFKHIYETFVRLAISHPEISFSFWNNDERIFDLPKAELLDRLSDIFTNEFTDSLIPVAHGNQLIKISGFIAKPNFTKKTKQDQFFYLNSRYFTSKNLNFAVYKGYDHLIEKGNYPSFFLFIGTDPKKVDVNVHPSKLEVKFEEEGAVFGFIVNAMRNALKDADLTFEIGFGSYDETPEKSESFFHKSHGNEAKITSMGNHSSGGGFTQKKDATIHSIFEASKQAEEKEEDILDSEKQANVFEHSPKSETERFNIWQFQKKYIMCQTETGVLIIDQHAAHERILYERALLWLESQSSFSQQLLIPIQVKLTKIDLKIAEGLKKELSNLGFNFKILPDDIIELYGLPSDVKVGDENKIFQQLIDQYKEYELKLNLEKRDNLAKSFACRSAIKANDALTQKEMLALVDNLFSAKMPYVCPHGRPTMIRITTEELDKRFSRS
ncbi:MAG: DNA mismatch repair endonuclease MutL [Ignavibacteriae bacterium]|nr:DNA mismatch repair endonuclease MutL [Ignavibacteriota bacterium]MCB9242960.1 DNA mismatch repair endonuclease MutL [Ignavibacteriales bacterium]